MEFGQDGSRLLALVVNIEPARGLGDEPAEEDDQAREEHLKVDRDGPADVSLESDRTADGARGQDGAGEPESVAVGSEDTTVGRVRGLNNVDGTSSRDDGDAETKQETTTLELTDVAVEGGGTVDDGANDDEPSTDLHANLPAPSIDSRTNEEQSSDTANLVHGRVDSSPRTVLGAVKEVKELLVGCQATEDGAVEAVHGLSKASEKDTADELPRSGVPERRSLLDEGFVVCLRALDNLDLCNIGLSDLLVEPKYSSAGEIGRTESTIFSTVAVPVLTSSTGDILKSVPCERTYEGSEVDADRRGKPTIRLGDPRYNIQNSSGVTMPGQGTLVGSGAARLAGERHNVGDLGQKLSIWARLTALRAHRPLQPQYVPSTRSITCQDETHLGLSWTRYSGPGPPLGPDLASE